MVMPFIKPVQENTVLKADTELKKPFNNKDMDKSLVRLGEILCAP